MKDMRDIQMPTNALSATKLSRLKWATTVAIIGIPVMGQVLGALVLFEDKYAFLTSITVILVVVFTIMLVLMSGLYVSINRMHLRFAGLNQGLDEWESEVQVKAQAFSYKVIRRGIFVAFIGISLLGLLGVLNAYGVTNLSFGQALQLNLTGMSALIIGLFYLIFFLPTLYMAWTLKPLSEH